MIQDSTPTTVKTKPKVSAVSFITWSAVIVSGLIVPVGIITFVVNGSRQAWLPASPNPEFKELVAAHLNIGQSFTFDQTLASASYRQVSDRFRVYRFDAPQTCGYLGCLNVVVDSHAQATKAFHLKPLDSPNADDLSIGENGCVAAIRSIRNELPEKFSLCLSQ
jgi:hypothetical protein